jgi:hypothetical protein
LRRLHTVYASRGIDVLKVKEEGKISSRFNSIRAKMIPVPDMHTSINRLVICVSGKLRAFCIPISLLQSPSIC